MNDVRHEYYLDGSRIVKETWADQTLEFLYDENKSVYCIVYTGGDGAGRYYLIKNLQGDVTRILNNNLETVAQYVYDPWGKLVYILDADGEPNSGISIANINPIRYRGYYFDMETGFYYLNARYYDPALGRFLNPDDFVATGQGLTSYNMYAYCNNNPTNLSDYTGSMPVRNTMAMMTDGGGKSITKTALVLYYNTGKSFTKQATEQFAFGEYYDQVDAIGFSTMNDLQSEWNRMNEVDDVYLYIHGRDGTIYAHSEGKRLDSNSMNELSTNKISGTLYLFACHGYDVAEAMARSNNCNVVSCDNGVSFSVFDGCAYPFAGGRRRNIVLGSKFDWYVTEPSGASTNLVGNCLIMPWSR